MARKSVTRQRQREIIDALERGIDRYGLDGTHLDTIARLSGILRPALRHFIGNRDKIIVHLADTILQDSERSRRLIERYAQRNPEKAMAGLLVHLLEQRPKRIKSIVALITYSDENEHTVISQKMALWYTGYTDWLTQLLGRHYGPPKQVKHAADAIMAILFSQSLLCRIDDGQTGELASSESSIALVLASLNQKNVKA